MNFKRIVIATFLLGSITSCRKHGEVTTFEEEDWYAGGSQTSYVFGAGAYGQAFSSLSPSEMAIHDVGDKGFEATFVSAPAPKNSGLGPIFNNVSCVSCHIGDGRGKPPGIGEQLTSMLIRVSIDGQDVHGGPMEAPFFGGQFQQKGIFGVQSEGDVNVNYTYVTEYFVDGTSYELRVPSYNLVGTYTGLPAGVMISPRVAPPVFGLGLLEAISDNSILANQDIYDADGDGISGKANYVWNIQKQKKTIGKFGWKAGAPSLIQQIAAAYNQDMGITNFLFPTESSYGQSQYDNLNDDVELSDSLLYAVTYYMQTLSVPAKRNINDPQVKEGKKIFSEANCISCHKPMMRTGTNVAFSHVSNQLIFPFTDLLLHDMGPALADNRPDNLANGNEWRTPPLWGIGLTEIVNGHSNFMHDGRARTLMEAIMWHGGEAESSKQYVRNLAASKRNSLIKYLQSL